MPYDHFAAHVQPTLAPGAHDVAQLIQTWTHQARPAAITAAKRRRMRPVPILGVHDIPGSLCRRTVTKRLELERVTHHLRAVALAATNAALTSPVEPLTSIANAS